MNKQEVRSIDDVGKYYEQVRPIRFEDDVKINHIQDIFKNIIQNEKNDNIKTVYTRGGHHCNSGRVRSLDDIFKLSKYYFPGILLGEIIKELCIYEEDQLESNNKLLYFGYCPDIRKSNFLLWDSDYVRTGFKEMIEKKYKYPTGLILLGFRNCPNYIYEL